MRVRPQLFVLLLLSALAGPLAAQESAIQPLDLTKRADRVGDKRWAGPGLAPVGSSRWNGSKTVRFSQWHGSFSNLGTQRAALPDQPVERRLAAGIAGPRSVPVRRPAEEQLVRESPRVAASGLGPVGEAGLYPADPRLQRQIPTDVEISREDFASGQNAPKLEDINRFVFRKNGVGERGTVPVTRAADDSEPK